MIYYCFLVSFILSVIIAPFYIKIAKKLKFGQNILGYVEEHYSKQGTPTMGGFIFILPTIIVSLIFAKSNLTLSLLCMAVFLSYAIVGFLDDFIKIKFKRNLGLRAYQKIIFQLAIALAVAFFVYKNDMIRGIYLPFSLTKVDFGWLIIPFIVLVFVATTNSVNLTDGLDGLAGSTSLIVFLFIALINSFYCAKLFSSLSADYLTQMHNLNVTCVAVSGSLLGFLVFNFYPAKIFMGDTGSLALGALLSCVCCFGGTSLYIPIVGIMFVVSSLSVILQVLHYKRTKKRIFLMAPFHHHLEHKGMNETKIVFIYIVITILVGTLTLALLGGI